MRKYLRLVLPIVVLALVAAACGSDDGDGGSDAGDLGGREVTIAVENLYPPFNFIPEGSTEGAGWDYDVWREICTRLNCTPVFVEATWPDLIIETGQGQFDTAADGISITEERKDTVAFSDPYMTVEQKLMIRLDEDRYGTVQAFLDDLDARLGTQVGTTNELLGSEILADFGGDGRLDAFESFPVAVLALINGDVDAVIIDDTAGQGFKGVNADVLKLIDESLQSDPLGFIYEHDSELIDPVNKVLKEMMEDGTLDRLAVTWFVEFEL